MNRSLLPSTLAVLFLTGWNAFAHPTGEVAWMGSYLNRTKVGYSLLAFNQEAAGFATRYGMAVPPPLPERTLLFSLAELDVKAYGQKNAVRWMTLATLKRDLSLEWIGFSLHSSDTDLHLEGRVEGQTLTFKIISAGATREEQVPLSQPSIYLPESIPFVLTARRNQGQSLNSDFWVLEPHQMTVSPWKIALDGIEKWRVAGKEVEVYRVLQDAGGLTTTTWMDAEGTVLKEYASLGQDLGYLSYRETEAQARNLAYVHPLVLEEPEVSRKEDPDLLYSSCVPAGRNLENPAAIRRMVIDLWDFQLDRPFPYSSRQASLVRNLSGPFTQGAPLRLEIRSATEGFESAPFSQSPSFAAKYSPWLRAEGLLQSDHPEIVEQARAIAAGLVTPWEKAAAIHDWVTDHVETEFRITLPSALEVLHSKKGDCNEQSTLLAALCRAVGVPAKICTGLVYQSGAFYYHAWNEVLVNEDPPLWIPLDAALDQSRVDATHIKFSEGGLAEQTYLNGLIGKIKAQIQEAETDDRIPDPDQEVRDQDRG